MFKKILYKTRVSFTSKIWGWHGERESPLYSVSPPSAGKIQPPTRHIKGGLRPSLAVHPPSHRFNVEKEHF